MDELLYARVEQLRELDDRLDRILRHGFDDVWAAINAIRGLRNELAGMIAKAQAEYDAF